MADESLREIQLNGKQLVFVFMAATVVAVVIFLSGVMVGRAVPESVALAASAEQAPVDALGLMADESAPLVAAPTEGPVAGGEELDYPRYLEPSERPEESLDPTAADPSVDEAVVEPPLVQMIEAAAPAPAAAVAAGAVVADSAEAADAALALPPDPGGWVVQVAAVSERPAAEAIAADLGGKGYAAFVTTPGASGPAVFRVRVGTFPDRREAESVAGRLEREEQFRPWVTR